eukprot:CCRYP_009620-RA/>CCRYP_009620-RA protein AED:0.39 eAED:-0.09 QI:0/0/0/0.5/1/1/2/0/355
MPVRYAGSDMSTAELRLMQFKAGLDLKPKLSLIGATGVGLSHTSELHVMNYKQAMASVDAAVWQVEVDKEHDRMVKNKASTIVPKASLPPKTKILKSVWAMKPKADGSKRARLNAKGCSQIAWQHYDADNISSPCDDVGQLQDYVDCKLDINKKERSLKMTQPVLVQSLFDEFDDIMQGKTVLVPAQPGDILTKCKSSPKLDPAKHSRYRTGTGKLLYLTKHSRPDIANAVRELSRHCHDPTKAHWDAMCQCIRYVRATQTRGLVLKPTSVWDGKDKNFKFKIRGRSNSNYATDPESRRSITGTVVYLNDAPIVFSSATQKHVTLSVTEAELAAVNWCAIILLVFVSVNNELSKL